MKQLLLATALIAFPVGAFTAYNLILPGAAPAEAASSAAAETSLGDMTAFKTIIADVQKIASSGDLVAAEKRITDFETGWDDAEATMRPLNRDAWGNVDDAADVALKSLRKGTPSVAVVSPALAALMATLENPAGSSQTNGAASAVTLVSGIAVTDDKGRNIPCEELLGTLRTSLSTTTRSATDKAKAAEFVTKATERCNADDDARADAFSAQGLALTMP